MSTRIAFLRAVNLGPTRKVGMGQLAAIATALGHEGVWPHINSGNVVFEATGSSRDMEDAFEAALEAELGFEVGTFVRSAADLDKALALEPFPLEDGDTYFVTFLKNLPTKAQQQELQTLSGGFDTIVTAGREVHWRMHGKSIDTKIPTKAWEQVIGHRASTSRNTNMLRKLSDKIEARRQVLAPPVGGSPIGARPQAGSGPDRVRAGRT